MVGIEDDDGGGRLYWGRPYSKLRVDGEVDGNGCCGWRVEG